jgi:hypothetical protein
MDVETEKATGSEGEGGPRDGTLSGPPAAASVPPASGEHEGGEFCGPRGLPAPGWPPPPDRGGGTGEGQGPQVSQDSTDPDEAEPEWWAAYLARRAEWSAGKVANARETAEKLMFRLMQASNAPDIYKASNILDEIRHALEPRATIVELADALDAAVAERDKLRAELDVLLNLIVQPWTRDGDGGGDGDSAQLWKVNLAWWETATSREEGVAMVRTAAGLEAKP